MDFRWEQGIKKLPDLTAKVGNYLQTTTTSSRGRKTQLDGHFHM